MCTTRVDPRRKEMILNLTSWEVLLYFGTVCPKPPKINKSTQFPINQLGVAHVYARMLEPLVSSSSAEAVPGELTIDNQVVVHPVLMTPVYLDQFLYVHRPLDLEPLQDVCFHSRIREVCATWAVQSHLAEFANESPV